jgi:hypothetical protein
MHVFLFILVITLLGGWEEDKGFETEFVLDITQI